MREDARRQLDILLNNEYVREHINHKIITELYDLKELDEYWDDQRKIRNRIKKLNKLKSKINETSSNV